MRDGPDHPEMFPRVLLAYRLFGGLMIGMFVLLAVMFTAFALATG